MIQWRPFAPWLTAAAAIGLGLFYQHSTSEDLAVERANTQAAVEAYVDAKNEAIGLEIVALQANQRADSIEAARAAAAPRVAAIVKAAPDTCKPVIAALQAQVHQLEAEVASRKDSFTEEKQAAAVLAPAADHVAAAAQELVKASKPSFFKRLIPDIGVGGAAGVSAIDRRPDAVIGVTFSWKVL